MLEREVVTHLNELTPRNVDSSRGQARLKKLQCFSLRARKNNKSVFTTHSQILSTVYNVFHCTGAVNRLICIIFRRNLHLVCFRPRKENPQNFNGSNEIHCWDPVFLHQISRYLKMFLSGIRLFACLGERYSQIEEPFVYQRKKWFRGQMSFIPSSKNPGRLRWRVDCRLWNCSSVFTFPFFLTAQPVINFTGPN